MKVQELSPSIRTFSFVPTESDDLPVGTNAMKVLICYEEYMLHVQSVSFGYYIKINRTTGNIIKDLLSMTRADLIKNGTLEKRFMFQESKNAVLKNMESALVDIPDQYQVKTAFDLVKGIDENYFFEDLEREHNATHFSRLVSQILCHSSFRNSIDQIVEVVTKPQSFAVTAANNIVSYLYPILQREMNMNTDEITKDEILNGLRSGMIQIINNEIDGCISARIGEYWFYFTGMEDELMSAELYLKQYNYDEITDMIHAVINSAPIKVADEDDNPEWSYYKCILNR